MAQKLKKIFSLLIIFLLLASPVWATDYTQDANCQGAWLMNVDEDPITDSSGNGNTGALKGAGEPDFASASPPAGYSSGYYVFDGTDDYIYNDSFSLTVTDPFTFVAWQYVVSGEISYDVLFNIGATGGGDRILAHMPFGDGTCYWDFGNATTGRVSTSYGAYDDKWTHIGLVSSGNANTFQGIYFDGGLVTSQNSSAAPSTGTKFYVGKYVDSGDCKQFSATQVAIFNRVLDSTEINDIMDNGLVGGGAPPAIIHIGHIINTLEFK